MSGGEMRSIFDTQQGLDFQPFDPKAGAGLEKMDEILNANKGILKLVAGDIAGGADKSKGRPGMSAEQVLRVAIVKQLYGWSYRLLRDRIEDSVLLRGFCRYDWQLVPQFQALQDNVKKLSPETLEELNRALVIYARENKIERGRNVRTDTTVVETKIHYPRDSSLIWDSVRVITRILGSARIDLPEARITFHDRTRVVKKRMKAIYNARNDEQRKGLYADMVKYGEEVLGYAREGVPKLLAFAGSEKITIEEEVLAQYMAEELVKFADLLERILDQTRRRVFKGENVPSKEKVVSIFEVHTDIIVKKRRETEFGHKVCFTVGKTSIVLDCMIGRGNPADSSLFPQAIDRQIDLYGESPASSAADGGFASLDNAIYAKASGVDNVYFNKQVGKETEKMFPSAWLRRKLRRFRAGIEGVISALKRAVGLGRCTWSGWKSFQSYVWSSIVAHNLKIMSRALLKREEAFSASTG